MIPFLDLKAINQRFESEFQNSLRLFLDSGYYILGNQVKLFEANFARYCGTTHCIGVGNGLDALRLILEAYKILGKLKENDEVLVASNTFIATILAIKQAGLKPVLVETDLDSYNFDLTSLKNAISEKTKAIMPVHLYGQLSPMGEILKISKENNLLVIEDAAQAIDGEWNGQKLGTFGSMSALSFHETKNIICGEGGALLINDPAFVQRAEIIREKGTNRSQFMRGMVQKYTWMDIGSSYLPSDMLAAYLVAQLENMEQIQSRRGEIFTRYYEGLRPLQESGKLTLPVFSTSSKINYHMFYFWVESRDVRDELIDFMRERDIQLVFHYQPLHVSPMGMKLGGKEGTLPVTEDIPHRLLRLPFFYDLTLEEQQRVLSGLFEFFGEEFSK